jgi:hypothetical protein
MRLLLIVSLPFLRSACSRNDDLFNYRGTNGQDFGPEDWDQVTCDDVTLCVSATDDIVAGIIAA